MVARAFDRWIDHQDESYARVASSIRAWVSSSIFVCLFLPFLSYGPGAHGYFGLRFVPALVCYLPGAAVGIAFAVTRGDNPFSRAAWLVYLVDCVLVQFFCASLIAWCSPRGAAAISSLFVFAAAYHGHLLRVTPSEPFVAVGTLLAAGGAALLTPTPERLQLFAFAGAAAFTAELIVGSNARRLDVARRSAEQLRLALNANVLDEQGREVKRLSETLVDVLGRNHDLNNALMALRLSTDAISIECERHGVTGVEPILASVHDCISRVSTLVDGIKSAGRPERDAVPPEVVDVLPVIDAVLVAVSARNPRVRYTLEADRSTALRSPIRGGGTTLRRILDNLLINAGEGDGTRAAGKVRLQVFRDPSGGRLQIVVTDNGPGFSSEQLGRDVEVFASTKPQGSGLGLYTCERLLRASGGQLERANAPGGGAELKAILPLVRS